jgi:formylglycine-generating enzyme required for sulfatase activity
MPAKSNKLAVLAIAALAVLAGDASARPRQERPKPRPAPAVEQAQTPPAPLPRQFFPEKGVQPLTPELEQTLRPKDSFKECENCPEMVVVPAGSFTMGTPADEP